jgi:hypothetical protein
MIKRRNEAPRSGPRRAPGGSVRQKQVVCNTTFDDPFRTIVNWHDKMRRVLLPSIQLATRARCCLYKRYMIKKST